MDGNRCRCSGKVAAPPAAARLSHDEIRGFPFPPWGRVGLFTGVEMFLLNFFNTGIMPYFSSDF
jgi:hypothetical protein